MPYYHILWLLIGLIGTLPSANAQSLEELETKLQRRFDQGAYLECIPLYRQIRTILQANEDWGGVVINYADVGRCYFELEDYRNTRIQLDSALLMMDYYKLDALSDAAATVWNFRGAYFEAVGDYKSAIQNFQKVLDIDRELYPQDTLTFGPYLGMDYLNLSTLSNSRGDYDRAIEYARYAFQYLDPSQSEYALLHNNLGSAFEKKRQNDRALQAYHRGRSALIKNPDNAARRNVQLLLYHNIANLHLRSGRIDSTEIYQERIERLLTDQDRIERADLLRIRGEILHRKGQLSQAETALEKAYQQYRAVYQTDQHPVLGNALRMMGDVQLERGATDRALITYQKAIATLVYDTKLNTTNFSYPNPLPDADMLDRLELVATLSGKATALEQTGALVAAEQTVQTALKILDRVRYQDLSQKSKYDLLERATPIYERAIGLAVRTEAYDRAFGLAERAKATLLLEHFQHVDARQFAGIPDQIIQQEFTFRNTLADYERQLGRALRRGAMAEVQELRNSIFEEQQAYEALLTQLEERYPDYYRLKYAVDYPTPDRVARRLLDDQSALLEYFVGDSTVYLFVLQDGDLEVQSIPRSPKADQQLEQFAGMLARPTDDPTDFVAYTAGAHDIYQRWVAPALRSLNPTTERLIIIADGRLTMIPFQTLIEHAVTQVRESRFDTLSYLINRYAISQAYSCAVLLENQHPSDRSSLRYAGFAPVFAGGTPANVRALGETEELAHLPFSEREVVNIGKLFEGDIYLKGQANRATFTEAARSNDVLHLSTHALLDGDQPGLSRIYFSDDYLTVEEIYNLPTSAKLTVLSACETGGGRLRRGEGIISLARAFTYAGCPSLVTSRWKVSDQSTEQLMVEFYKHLKHGARKDVALQRAQRQYLANLPSKTAAHPFYWGAFVQLGDSEAMCARTPWWTYVVVAVITLLLLIPVWRR